MAINKSVKNNSPSFLERFGVYYIILFYKQQKRKDLEFTDDELRKKVNIITYKGIFLSSVAGMILVYPTVWVDIYYSKSSFLIHYGWVAAVTLVSIIIEVFLLFLIALKAVNEVSAIVNINAEEVDINREGPFNVKNILARAALEINDPEISILGINPFERISKKNLLVLSLLYKAKIFLTNFIVKLILTMFFGPLIFGISILYEAVFVEAFWNGVVLKRVVNEARLRLFGFTLANHIVKEVLKDNLYNQLSDMAKIGCFRAIANAVVMAQNYHPNMIILLLYFQKIAQIDDEHQLDNFEVFLKTLDTVNIKERNMMLDLFTIAVSFDGKLSKLTLQNLKIVYKNDYDVYYKRLVLLTESLRVGHLNEAILLSKVDFIAG